MSQFYSDETRETDPHALPDCEVFQLTAEEAAVLDEDAVREAMKLFPLANMNGRDRAKLVDYLIAQNGSQVGWYYWFCFPGCMADGEPNGPFTTAAEAIANARCGG